MTVQILVPLAEGGEVTILADTMTDAIRALNIAGITCLPAQFEDEDEDED